jgi:hypothetical protein
MVLDLMNDYVLPCAYAMMSGELPAVTCKIYRTESNDNDWTASVHLKNTLTISVFRCEIYIADIISFCRRCKMYLVTPEVFKPVALFYILHGLLQMHNLDFKNDASNDFDSMMVGASYEAYKFIKSHYEFTDSLEKTVIDIVWYYSMILTNNYKHAPRTIRVGDRIDQLYSDYVANMELYHHEAWRSAKRQKAQTYQVDEDGFIVLERVTKGSTRYVGRSDEIV